MLGTKARIFGDEVDGLDYRFDTGLPYPTGANGAAGQVTILVMKLATMREACHGVWGEALYIGGADTAFKAQAMTGRACPEAINATKRGSGMIIHWPKGKGEVFCAATCEWVTGLIRCDAQVDQIARNVLDRFATRDAWATGNARWSKPLLTKL